MKIASSWLPFFQEEFEKRYMENLRSFLVEEYSNQIIHPDMYDIFRCFRYCERKDINVIIIGQDPYPSNYADGLCFSAHGKFKGIPASLKSIFKEIKSDIGVDNFKASCHSLEKWARQGVLLLNAVLTVRENEPFSHGGRGWEQFTDMVLMQLAEDFDNLVFLLWGSVAQRKIRRIDLKKHYVLQTTHPVPYAAKQGFWGSNHFSKTNTYLKSIGKEPIDWSL
jgi:uracil-DNA glycosylase